MCRISMSPLRSTPSSSKLNQRKFDPATRTSPLPSHRSSWSSLRIQRLPAQSITLALRSFRRPKWWTPLATSRARASILTSRMGRSVVTRSRTRCGSTDLMVRAGRCTRFWPMPARHQLWPTTRCVARARRRPPQKPRDAAERTSTPSSGTIMSDGLVEQLQDRELSAPVIKRLSFLDRFLPAWIILAMAVGIGLGRAIPSLNTHLNAVQVTSGTSLPIFIGLLVMMYPVLAKVRYDRLGTVTRDRKLLVSSLVLNWLIGPAVMFTLAWLLLPDLPTYRTGLIIVGLARCIAMVLIWNDLSGGHREAAAVLVALNSLFQIVAFSLLGYFYLELLPKWLGLSTQGLHLSVWK